MKKIILSLVLVFGLMFGGNVYGYSIEEGKETIIELKKEVSKYGYKIKELDNNSSKKDYIIFYNKKKVGNIYYDENGISLFIKNDKYGDSFEDGFYKKDFPLEHILYYFDNYKNKSKVINGVIKNIDLGHNDIIKKFPGTKEKYYLNIRYLGDDNQSFLPNAHLITKYILKNDCSSKKEKNKDGEKEEYIKCVEDSILEHYIDSKITIKIKQSPDFIKLKKDEKGLDYFEIDLENNDYDSIGKYGLEFDVFLNGQKKGFNKKVIINVIKPIILIVGELGPDGGTIYNNWKDISISVEKGLLDKKYKISRFASEEGLHSFISSEEFLKTDDGSSTSYYLDTKIPNLTLLHKNYLSGTNYWTTISNNLNSTDVKNYNKCILDKKKTNKEKYTCFKKYMGFSTLDNKYNYSKNKLKCTKKGDENHNSGRTCIDIFFEEEDDVPYSNVIILSTDKEEIYTKLEKQLTTSKLKLKKNPQYGKIVPKFENIIFKISDKKLLSIDKKMGKFSEKVRNNKKYKDILDYLEAKIKLEIIIRELN